MNHVYFGVFVIWIMSALGSYIFQFTAKHTGSKFEKTARECRLESFVQSDCTALRNVMKKDVTECFEGGLVLLRNGCSCRNLRSPHT